MKDRGKITQKNQRMFREQARFSLATWGIVAKSHRIGFKKGMGFSRMPRPV